MFPVLKLNRIISYKYLELLKGLIKCHIYKECIIAEYSTFLTKKNIICLSIDSISNASISNYLSKRSYKDKSLDHHMSKNAQLQERSQQYLSQAYVDSYFNRDVTLYELNDIIKMFEAVARQYDYNTININNHLDKINQFLAHISPISNYDISQLCTLLYGLCNTKSLSHSKDLQKFLSTIIFMLTRAVDKFQLIDIIQALYGIRYFYTRGDAHNLLPFLVSRLENSFEILNPRTIPMAVSGLQSRYDDCDVCIRLIKALSVKIKNSIINVQLSASEVCSILNGLKMFSSDSLGVLELVHSIIPLVKSCPQRFSPYDIRESLQGLQNMKSDSIIIQNLLEVLHDKIISSHHYKKYDGRSISDSVYGLQNMSTKHQQVAIILNDLGTKAMSCHDSVRLNAAELSNIFYGLAYKTVPSNLITFIEKNVTHILSEMENTPNNFQPINYLCLYQSILLSCYIPTFFCQFTKAGQNSIIKLKNVTETYVESHPEMKLFRSEHKENINKSEYQRVNEIECRLRKQYSKEFQNGEAKLLRNALLYGFECDMIFYLNGQIINFEIDGASHLHPTKKTFTARRDHYLIHVHKVVIDRRPIYKKIKKTNSR